MKITLPNAFERKNFLKNVPEAIDIRSEMFYSAIPREEVNDGSILHEVSHQEGDEVSEGDHHEKWQAGHPGNLPDLRHQDVPHWQELD